LFNMKHTTYVEVGLTVTFSVAYSLDFCVPTARYKITWVYVCLSVCMSVCPR